MEHGSDEEQPACLSQQSYRSQESLLELPRFVTSLTSEANSLSQKRPHSKGNRDSYHQGSATPPNVSVIPDSDVLEFIQKETGEEQARMEDAEEVRREREGLHETEASHRVLLVTDEMTERMLTRRQFRRELAALAKLKGVSEVELSRSVASMSLEQTPKGIPLVTPRIDTQSSVEMVVEDPTVSVVNSDEARSGDNENSNRRGNNKDNATAMNIHNSKATTTTTSFSSYSLSSVPDAAQTSSSHLNDASQIASPGAAARAAVAAALQKKEEEEGRKMQEKLQEENSALRAALNEAQRAAVSLREKVDELTTRATRAETTVAATQPSSLMNSPRGRLSTTSNLTAAPSTVTNYGSTTTAPAVVLTREPASRGATMLPATHAAGTLQGITSHDVSANARSSTSAYPKGHYSNDAASVVVGEVAVSAEAVNLLSGVAIAAAAANAEASKLRQFFWPVTVAPSSGAQPYHHPHCLQQGGVTERNADYQEIASGEMVNGDQREDAVTDHRSPGEEVRKYLQPMCEAQWNHNNSDGDSFCYGTETELIALRGDSDDDDASNASFVTSEGSIASRGGGGDGGGKHKKRRRNRKKKTSALTAGLLTVEAGSDGATMDAHVDFGASAAAAASPSGKASATTTSMTTTSTIRSNMNSNSSALTCLRVPAEPSVPVLQHISMREGDASLPLEVRAGTTAASAATITTTTVGVFPNPSEAHGSSVPHMQRLWATSVLRQHLLLSLSALYMVLLLVQGTVGGGLNLFSEVGGKDGSSASRNRFARNALLGASEFGAIALALLLAGGCGVLSSFMPGRGPHVLLVGGSLLAISGSALVYWGYRGGDFSITLAGKAAYGLGVAVSLIALFLNAFAEVGVVAGASVQSHVLVNSYLLTNSFAYVAWPVVFSAYQQQQAGDQQTSTAAWSATAQALRLVVILSPLMVGVAFGIVWLLPHHVLARAAQANAKHVAGRQLCSVVKRVSPRFVLRAGTTSGVAAMMALVANGCIALLSCPSPNALEVSQGQLGTLSSSSSSSVVVMRNPRHLVAVMFASALFAWPFCLIPRLSAWVGRVAMPPIAVALLAVSWWWLLFAHSEDCGSSGTVAGALPCVMCTGVVFAVLASGILRSIANAGLGPLPPSAAAAAADSAEHDPLGIASAANLCISDTVDGEETYLFGQQQQQQRQQYPNARSWRHASAATGPSAVIVLSALVGLMASIACGVACALAGVALSHAARKSSGAEAQMVTDAHRTMREVMAITCAIVVLFQCMESLYAVYTHFANHHKKGRMTQ